MRTGMEAVQADVYVNVPKSDEVLDVLIPHRCAVSTYPDSEACRDRHIAVLQDSVVEKRLASGQCEPAHSAALEAREDRIVHNGWREISTLTRCRDKAVSAVQVATFGDLDQRLPSVADRRCPEKAGMSLAGRPYRS